MNHLNTRNIASQRRLMRRSIVFAVTFLLSRAITMSTNPVTMDTSVDTNDQSVISDTSTLSRATMATMVNSMHLNNSRFQNEMRISMTEQEFSNLLAQLQAAAIQPGNTQASPTRTASPGEVPFSTEEPPPGSSAL